jgi:ATPase family associated with various cellular activities (AAA)
MAKASSGGKAAHEGTDYQNRAAAWFAARILAERDVGALLETPASVTWDSIICESDQPVDDFIVKSSAGGFLFCQAKRSIDLGTTTDSELASVVDQFIRQFDSARNCVPDALSPGRALDRDRDRLVLVTSSDSSAPLRRYLSSVLQRLRELAPHRHGGTTDSLARTDAERHALSVVRDHVVRVWRSETRNDLTDSEIGSVLELVYILVLEIDPDQTHEREARGLLRTSILKDPERSDAAWSTLIKAFALRAKGRSGFDRAGLQKVLVDEGHDLSAVRSFRDDIERLKQHSRSTSGRFENLVTIDVGLARVRIDRPCTAALVREAPGRSLLVVGEPGTGKSVALHSAVNELQGAGRDVVYIAADSLVAESLGQPRAELNLEHDVVEILANWPGTAPGILVIDALDAARSDGASRTLRDLIRAVLNSVVRWRVLASIREFDLRYSLDLPQLFRGTPVSDFEHPQFGSVNHLCVPRWRMPNLTRSLVSHQSSRCSSRARTSSCAICYASRSTSA